ncbi:protein ovarian tumor locus-like [Anopheles arabiensis]|uniref:protein ovarian tumor locus-like n=1 Tax=Anopheles arabiensis TaxID=7173 RepID=UPI001AACBC24|nr:protein ovarian tumor locus-like [Anopheles arabiensis]
MSENRVFGFGCREAPDICDKFLENQGYYRKHTALDSSSLFRVVSEQQYSIQLHHEEVRKQCVNYMRANRAQFKKDIKWDFEGYLENMSRQKTHGTLVELKALAHLHKANVRLFEPFADGKWFLQNDSYDNLWRVFIGRNNHFDSIYTMDHITNMAECQAIVYDILYTKVLLMPDVQYAVERMLHDPEDHRITYDEDEQGSKVVTTEDGRQMKLSAASETECVLKNSQLCHFHNITNFDAIQQFFAIHGSAEGYRVYVGLNVRQGVRKPNPLLEDQNLSCVRQLLNLGITPFPYKVVV